MLARVVRDFVGRVGPGWAESHMGWSFRNLSAIVEWGEEPQSRGVGMRNMAERAKARASRKLAEDYVLARNTISSEDWKYKREDQLEEMKRLTAEVMVVRAPKGTFGSGGTTP